MAYGVKYRLEFSDVLGNAKKIEIEKDGYSGTVLPLIGTADPVSIKWEGDDDFYSPIIGSTCTLNLFVTDTVQYDNFYAFNEEEFKVKIYYKDDADVYRLYWAGFIVTDSYKQSLQSTPFEISIQAHDGIGLLSTQFMEIRNTDGFQLATGVINRDLILNFIVDAIAKTNLELNVYISTGFRTNVFDNSGGNTFSKYTNDLKVVDCKTFIENVCKKINARIFQSHGNWYVINNSEYLDHDFFDDQVDGTISSNIRNAETKMLQTEGSENPEFAVYLNNGSFVFNSSGTDVLIKTKTDLTPINNDLIVEYIPPTKIIETTANLLSRNDFGKIQNNDPFFELPTNNWTITSSRAEIGEFGYALKGTHSIRTNQSTNSSSTFTQMFLGASNDPGDTLTFSKDSSVNYSFNYYLNGTLGTGSSVPFAINYNIERIYNFGTLSQVSEFWDTENEEWVSTAPNNQFEVDTANSWQSFNVTTTETQRRINCVTKLIFYLPYKHSGTNMTHLYFDDIRFEKDEDFFKNEISSRELTINSRKLENKYNDIQGLTSAQRARSGTLLSFEELTTQQKINDFRTFLSRYEGTFYNNIKTPISPRNKIWVDFTKVFIQYVNGGQEENRIYTNDSVADISVGDYVTGGNPSSPITTEIQVTQVVTGSPNYIVIDDDYQSNVGDVFAITEQSFVNVPVSNEYATHEPVSCMIDSMEYNVKANTVSVVMHVPNQDDDVSSTFNQTFE
jgi:hypothetical protein